MISHICLCGFSNSETIPLVCRSPFNSTVRNHSNSWAHTSLLCQMEHSCLIPWPGKPAGRVPYGSELGLCFTFFLTWSNNKAHLSTGIFPSESTHSLPFLADILPQLASQWYCTPTWVSSTGQRLGNIIPFLNYIRWKDLWDSETQTYRWETLSWKGN